MLKTDMIDKLNEQMNLELYSSLLYQQMSASGAVTTVLKAPRPSCVAMLRKR